MFAQHFRQFTRVNARDAGYLFAFQPVSQAFYSVPVAVRLGVIAHDDGFGMDAFALHERSQPVRFDGERWHTVVAH